MAPKNVGLLMCGITGYLVKGSEAVCSNTLLKMANEISHRGPDDEGIWVDLNAGIGIAHRRLSILDLSQAGKQPMRSKSGRFILSFNGEIYNHLSIRSELMRKGVSVCWQGHSDTETLLAAIDIWGIDEALQKTVGMFAFALWDRQERTLTLCRDRFGEKPLYYGWQGIGRMSVFLFGSELSAIRVHPAFNAEINRDALASYMRHNCIGSKDSIFKGIHKLEPGSLVTVSRDKKDPIVRSWWSSSDVAVKGRLAPFGGTPIDAVNELEKLLKDSIRMQMVTDVPLGAFLSGGVDSSTVVALMQVQSNKPVQTFSIGFHESEYNEAIHAKKVACHLGTKHNELYVTSVDALKVIPKLPTLYAEPFADSSQIPTFLVSQLARQHVAVSLSGDAGDELFCGYNRYVMTKKLWGVLSRMPKNIRQIIGRVITTIPPSIFDNLDFMNYTPNIGDKLHKGADLLGSKSIGDLYSGLTSHWRETSIVLGAAEPVSSIENAINSLSALEDVDYMMLLDLLKYLPDDILVKIDRAAMGVGLETRVPFLDHRIVEFAWSLPLNYKLNKGITKWPLRQVLNRYVPRELIERPKMGFGVPIGKWLRGPLREWAETLLSESRLMDAGFFSTEPIRKKWSEHLSGKRNWQHLLWDVLMFQAWLESQK